MMKNVHGQGIDETINKILRSKNNNNSNTTYIYLEFVSFPSMIDQIILNNLQL